VAVVGGGTATVSNADKIAESWAFRADAVVITPESGGNEMGMGEGNAGATVLDDSGGVPRFRWVSGGR